MLIRYEARQMMRTPLRLTALLLALAMMTVIMTVSAGLYLACQSALLRVDEEYITIARDFAPSLSSYGTKGEYNLAYDEYQRGMDMFLLHKKQLETVTMYTDHNMYAAYACDVTSKLTADDTLGGYSYTVDSPANMVLLVVHCDSAEELPSHSGANNIPVPRAGYRMTVEEVVMAHENIVIAKKLLVQSAVRFESDNSMPFVAGERYLVWGQYEGGTDDFGTFTLAPDWDGGEIFPKVSVSDTDANLIGAYIRNGDPVPIAAMLGEMSAEEFRQSSDWTAWSNVIKLIEVSIDTIRIFSSDSVLIHESFLNKTARLVAGRDFTAQELEAKARVCVIHADLAAENGLSVGDVIDLSFYRTSFAKSDHVSNYPQQFNWYTPKSEASIATESGGYEIVGIYETDAQPESRMALHPNTVLIPQSTLTTSVRDHHPYYEFTLVIPNGGVDALEAEMETYGIGKIFRYEDGGYSDVIPHLTMMSESVRSIALLCFGIWVLIVIALTVLYTAMQLPHARVKFCVGVPKYRIWGHTLLGGLLLIFTAVLIGTGASILLYDSVLTKLMTSGFTVFYGAFGERETSDILAQVYRLLQQSPQTLCRLGALQLGVLSGWLVLLSAWFSLRSRFYRK